MARQSRIEVSRGDLSCHGKAVLRRFWKTSPGLQRRNPQPAGINCDKSPVDKSSAAASSANKTACSALAGRILRANLNLAWGAAAVANNKAP
jgi:hypothetical protein